MPVRTIITDFDLIEKAFQEFARTGQLSEAYEFYDPLLMNSWPNVRMAVAHAEVSVLLQIIEAAQAKGEDLFLEVEGQDVCDFCRCHLVLLAKAEEVKSLTVEARDGSGELRSYFWRPGMPRLEQKDEMSSPSGSRVIRGHILFPDGSLRRLHIADPSEAVVRSSLQACRDRRCSVKIEGPVGVGTIIQR
jgi:hypothetical protein